MAYFPQPHYTLRAPRVRLAKSPKILFIIENRRLEGVLQKLSLTGGSARVSRDCKPGELAELKINTANGHLEALVELLPQTEGEQPFRFIALGDSDQELLAATVTKLRQSGYGDGIASTGF